MPNQFSLKQLVNASEGQIIAQAYKAACAKRDRVIAREGDANGERLSIFYLDVLAVEEYNAMMQTRRQWAAQQQKSSA